jgi:hypothetical protein
MTTLCANIGSTGDAMLPMNCQEQAASMSYPSYGGTYSNTKSKLKTKKLARVLIYIQDPTLSDLYNAQVKTNFHHSHPNCLVTYFFFSLQMIHKR